jgi:hypothetical protein
LALFRWLLQRNQDASTSLYIGLNALSRERKRDKHRAVGPDRNAFSRSAEFTYL